jgi:hypothetical protein
MYPSLLFWTAPFGEIISPDVFEDLRLTQLLTEASIGTISKLCNPDDIPLRQAAYADIVGNIGAFSALFNSAEKVNRLHAAFLTARSDPERDYIHAKLISAYVKFAALAADIPGNSDIVKNFREAFCAEVGGGVFKRISAELLKIDAININPISFKVSGNSLKAGRSDGGEESFVERLRHYANELGLDAYIEQREPNMRLNTRIINHIAELYSAEFSELQSFYNSYNAAFDTAVLKYADELRLYLELAELYARFGYPNCMPTLSGSKRFTAIGLRDVSLIVKECVDVVGNEAYFTEAEPFFFLVGANGGGKTTYLRSVGIAALMARSGFPVAAERLEFYPVRNIYTHFPRDEHGESRLADEQRRIAEIMEAQRGDSMVLLNETYSTTTQDTAAELTAALAARLTECGSIALYITHQRSVTAGSILSVVVDDANRRTFKIARADSAGSSYAADILKRYGLDRDSLEG